MLINFFNYFPWAFKIPITITTLKAMPTAKEREVTGNAHINPAAPDKVFIIYWFGIKADLLAGARQASLGFGAFFGTSFAIADNTEVNSVKLKILITTVKPKSKDFRFDLGASLDLLG